jgi:hypothetical protein
MATTIPTEAGDPNSAEARYIAAHGIESFKREYRNGWKAAEGESVIWNNGGGSTAWESGYLDRAAGRERWHLLRCPDHNTCGEA